MNFIKWATLVMTFTLLIGCESPPPEVTNVNNPDTLTLTQFETPDESLSKALSVTMDDGSTLNTLIDWETSLDTFDTDTPGTFEIEGTLENDEFENPNNLKAVQEIIIEPVSIEQAMNEIDKASHFSTLYAALEHPKKTDVATLFIPSNSAIDEVLQFLEVDLQGLIDHTAFEPIMLDHMSEETISSNRLNTNVPGVYETLRGKELIVEGEMGNPLIDREHALQKSYELSDGHIHVIEGMVLSEDTLSMVGQELFDDAMGERLLEILREQGLMGDILLGRKFTFFIPGESALIDYAQNEGLSMSELLESPEFETLIMGHIVRDEYSAESLYTNAPQTLTAVNGNTIDITVIEGNLHAGNTRVTDTQTIEQAGTLLTIDGILESQDE